MIFTVCKACTIIIRVWANTFTCEAQSTVSQSVYTTYAIKATVLAVKVVLLQLLQQLTYAV